MEQISHISFEGQASESRGASEYLFGAFSILLMGITAWPLLSKLIAFADNPILQGLAAMFFHG